MKHDFISVKDIFEKYKVIHVPYYQRDYVWGQKNDGRNLYKFIDDIFTQYRDNPTSDYFIGTLAFCSSRVNDVIDGQQRLTSLILILSILSKLKCSQSVKEKNDKLLLSEDGTFVIQEEFYLTEELKYNLGLENNFNPHGHLVDISKTIDRITSQINNAWSDYTENWYDSLYNYILNNVKLISLEYSNISESLKYFLNINSLSIQLTQADIFYSILSQSIRLAETGDSIFKIKQKIDELASNLGIVKGNIDEYKHGYDDPDEIGINNVIYIFLNAYYKGDSNIMSLGETGIGKWMSFYKNEVFNDAIKAREFTIDFTQYLQDFEKIYNYFSNKNISLDKKSSLYISWILLQYEKYGDILTILIELFKNRHNYINADLYESGVKEISIDKMNEVAKRLNLTLLWNYIRNSTRRTDAFITNISVNTDGNYTNSISDIVDNININDIFNLTYNDHKGVSKINVRDNARLIKVVFACQESFLDKTADDTYDFGEYLLNILSGTNFSIEHLYSVAEYSNAERLNNWQNKKSKFNQPEDFDNERFRFENLSLLDQALNSSAGTDEIREKLAKYKTARKIMSSNWEYLIQSFADDSEYYRNEKIQALGLPERRLINIDQNTWELSENNRQFNVELMKMAINEIANR